MKVISIFNQKGGVGKTTTNINLCSYLAMKGYKILTIDIDPQGNTTSGFGIDKANIEKSIYNIMTEDTELKDVILKSQLIENLYVAPSTIELAGAEIEIIETKNRETILKDKIKNLDIEYDYIFIDCPPSLGLLTINSLCASDSVLIPIQAEFYALEGVGQLVNTIELVKKSLNKSLYVEGVILTMFDNRTKLSNEVYNEVDKYFMNKVFKTTIPRNIRLAEAPSFGLPILLYDNKCKGAEYYNSLTDEFITRQER
ncbi:sporulation initiation inhibitor protein Soj [Clostridium pasteurianum DSM 525 = ATCC 6013]|uniref:Sporulation initiation inhibitor protein Soj n=1 Tax=Clostridium pasteurianum DSM 525 = ATCC 6013 TaxID=1262449 RepID=A0A0H3J9H3_CLOPA|nr:AAA family ATPase [Clostridium pasteurianum]AJA50119.1 sporulation initiation inhibitor protein Soj [Clostridium pasteurianum DSM 525 = ATCC 6013]AJA54107.1 sporulation initiation inhibitor protein Soj [Clostridium pasteurianum DSM 525 = ATCC 6013]AOZ77233.1 sporulation initiation inhibitor Soj [Clostridium pasteurianum DSM 525 = ATCC 6013]AOZ81029.1 sporulation initiation inhibitor Soj [Clostridium pasteurianum]ELP59182.1 Chromosome partitioning MinD-family ATPase, SOJ [Clostridium pasteur